MTTPPTAPKTHQSMRQESDRRIVAAALERFASCGYHRASLNQIAAEAGFTGALISKRYGSKAGLAQAVLHDIRGQLTPGGQLGTRRGRRATSASDDLDELLQGFFQAVSEVRTELGAFTVLLGESLGGIDEVEVEVVAVIQALRDHVAAIVRRGQEHDEVRQGLDPEHVAVVVVGALVGVAAHVSSETDDHGALFVELRRALIEPLLRDPTNREVMNRCEARTWRMNT